jgi:hypothetical protein
VRAGWLGCAGRCLGWAMATRVVDVNDILDGHVGLDLECFDRIYLNGWVPTLQVPGQVVGFLTRASGVPDPVSGDLGADRAEVPQGGHRLRRRG